MLNLFTAFTRRDQGNHLQEILFDLCFNQVKFGLTNTSALADKLKRNMTQLVGFSIDANIAKASLQLTFDAVPTGGSRMGHHRL